PFRTTLWRPVARAPFTRRWWMRCARSPTPSAPSICTKKRDVVTRTGYNKRLLYTLHQCGFLDKVGENHYRLASEVRRRRLYRIGYAAQGQDTSFDREVRTGLVRAAEREHVELIVVDNRYKPKIALRSADYLITEQVDLVIE